MGKQKLTPLLSIDKFIVGIIITTILLLLGGVFLANKIAPSAQIEPDADVEVKVEKMAYDWGTIDMDDGEVEATFDIKSQGAHSLKLFNVKTSCMCTTAQLSLGKQTSPVFGMHSKSDYVLEIPTGESGQLRVVFDPAYHGPSGVGPITRQVEISTNDPNKPKLTFVLTATVLR